MVIPKPVHEQAAEPGETKMWNRELSSVRDAGAGGFREKPSSCNQDGPFSHCLQSHTTDEMKV